MKAPSDVLIIALPGHGSFSFMLVNNLLIIVPPGHDSYNFMILMTMGQHLIGLWWPLPLLAVDDFLAPLHPCQVAGTDDGS